MSEEKKQELKHYELLYIISNKFSEEEIKPIAEKVGKLIKSHEGNISYVEEWGKKKMSYPIKHFDYGYYQLLEFDLLPENLQKINQELEMTSEILRHMIVAKAPRTAESIKKEKRQITKRAQEIAAPDKEDKKEDKEKKEKVDIKELDKKLDKILDTDDLL